jgi:hypothetical protein
MFLLKEQIRKIFYLETEYKHRNIQKITQLRVVETGTYKKFLSVVKTGKNYCIFYSENWIKGYPNPVTSFVYTTFLLPSVVS